MAIAVVLPRFGWNIETGALTEWLKRDGDMVQAGDLLCTVETDKAVMEVEALDSGILRIPPDALSLGVDLAVGTVLAYLVQPGELAPFETTSAPTRNPVAPPDDVPLLSLVARTASPAAPRGHPAISPRARRVAGDLGVEWSHLRGSGRSGRIVERDVRAAVQPDRNVPVVYASWSPEMDTTDPASRG